MFGKTREKLETKIVEPIKQYGENMFLLVLASLAIALTALLVAVARAS